MQKPQKSNSKPKFDYTEYRNGASIFDFKELFPEEEFIIEEHEVETTDGWILSLHRVQNHTKHRGVSQEIGNPQKWPKLTFFVEIF